jgi:hypothetical protein
MIPTGENGRTWRKPCTIATFPSTNPTWTELGSNVGLCVEKQIKPPELWHGFRVVLGGDLQVMDALCLNSTQMIQKVEDRRITGRQA